MVKNDKTDPDGPDDPDGNAAAAAVDCATVESKGGAVAELVARNASNPGNQGRLAARCPDGGFPMSPKVRLDTRRRRGGIDRRRGGIGRRRGGIGRSRGSIGGSSSWFCGGVGSF